VDINVALADVLNISNKEAKSISKNMDMETYISLAQSLDDDNFDKVRKIVSRYNIKENINFIPIKNIDKSLLTSDITILEDFNYFVFFKKNKSKEMFIKWLEDNKIKYTVDDHNNFKVKCTDRDDIYKVGRKVTFLNRMYDNKELMRDGKEKPKTTSKFKNPVAKEIKNRTGSGRHGLSKYSRKEKHKNDVKNLSELLEVGDNIIANGQPATVKLLKGPKGSIGVSIKEEMWLVNPKNIERIDENIIGVSKMPIIGRMSELAGIRQNVSTSKVLDNKIEEIFNNNIDNNEVDTDKMPNDSISDAEQDINNIDYLENLPDSMEALESDAYVEIANSIELIINKIDEVKLSEYKMILNELEKLFLDVKKKGNKLIAESFDLSKNNENT